MGTHIDVAKRMKTTIDIADNLILRAKAIQAREDVTLRALVEDGLREVIAQREALKKHRFVPVLAGPAKLDVSLTPKKVNQMINELHQREWIGRTAPKASKKRRRSASGSRRSGTKQST